MTKAVKLDATAISNTPEFSISELSGAIKRALEDGFGHVRLRGEVSGYRGPHSSGHCYFGLKDAKSKIDAVVWRGVFNKLKVKPEEGMEVIAQGKITTYPGSSKYQIVIDSIEPAGVGALMALLEARKKQFASEGLFADERKKPIPFLPRVIGIVTSPTGAVIQDMLHGFEERFPAHVIVWPVRVQGETCALEVAAAIEGFNALTTDGSIPRPDVLIIARGGGSLEDLWGFNEEVVVRAASQSQIPLISAVGHETDWTLVDLVADARAPTPTKAAEWAVPKYTELVEQTRSLRDRLGTSLVRQLANARANLKAATRGLPNRDDILALPQQRFDAIERRLSPALTANTRAHALRHTNAGARLAPALMRATASRRSRHQHASGRLHPSGIKNKIVYAGERLIVAKDRAARALSANVINHRRALDARTKLLASLSYQGVLKRGFAIVREQSGAAIRRADAIAPGTDLEIEFSDGRIAASNATALSDGVAERQKKTRTPRKPKGPDQGTLF